MIKLFQQIIVTRIYNSNKIISSIYFETHRLMIEKQLFHVCVTIDILIVSSRKFELENLSTAFAGEFQSDNG